MKDLYQIAGISKQALWSYRKRKVSTQGIVTGVIDIIDDLRARHKEMGCRTIYNAAKVPLPVGRDRFIEIGHSNGYKLKRKRTPFKTTWAQRVEIYPNLMDGMELDNINQGWQSDIFYLRVEDSNYYGVTIEDVYSRLLLALHLSKSLSAKQNLAALKKAIRYRKGHQLEGCIFHSDRGSQYISKEHTALLKSKKMRISMCKMPQQNAYVERIQGTLKNQYFYPHQPTESDLQGLVRKIIRYYNLERPHRNLGMKTPAEFEQQILKMDQDQRPKMKIYKWNNQLSTEKNRNQQKEKRSKKEKSNNNSNLE